MIDENKILIEKYGRTAGLLYDSYCRWLGKEQGRGDCLWWDDLPEEEKGAWCFVVFEERWK